jgi:small subunit ribosomal protein S16
MVKIRLMRVGKRKQPSYRVVVADSRSPRDGRIIEAIGRYQPRTEPSEVVIDTDRARYWLDRGAQPSEQVRRLLDIAIEGKAAPEPKPKVKATPAASVDEAEAEAAPGAPVEEAAPAETPEAVEGEPAEETEEEQKP